MEDAEITIHKQRQDLEEANRKISDYEMQIEQYKKEKEEVINRAANVTVAELEKQIIHHKEELKLAQFKFDQRAKEMELKQEQILVRHQAEIEDLKEEQKVQIETMMNKNFQQLNLLHQQLNDETLKVRSLEQEVDKKENENKHLIEQLKRNEADYISKEQEKTRIFELTLHKKEEEYKEKKKKLVEEAMKRERELEENEKAKYEQLLIKFEASTKRTKELIEEKEILIRDANDLKASHDSIFSLANEHVANLQQKLKEKEKEIQLLQHRLSLAQQSNTQNHIQPTSDSHQSPPAVLHQINQESPHSVQTADQSTKLDISQKNEFSEGKGKKSKRNPLISEADERRLKVSASPTKATSIKEMAEYKTEDDLSKSKRSMKDQLVIEEGKNYKQEGKSLTLRDEKNQHRHRHIHHHRKNSHRIRHRHPERKADFVSHNSKRTQNERGASREDKNEEETTFFSLSSSTSLSELALLKEDATDDDSSSTLTSHSHEHSSDCSSAGSSSSLSASTSSSSSSSPSSSPSLLKVSSSNLSIKSEESESDAASLPDLSVSLSSSASVGSEGGKTTKECNDSGKAVKNRELKKEKKRKEKKQASEPGKRRRTKKATKSAKTQTEKANTKDATAAERKSKEDANSVVSSLQSLSVSSSSSSSSSSSAAALIQKQSSISDTPHTSDTHQRKHNTSSLHNQSYSPAKVQQTSVELLSSPSSSLPSISTSVTSSSSSSSSSSSLPSLSSSSLPTPPPPPPSASSVSSSLIPSTPSSHFQQAAERISQTSDFHSVQSQSTPLYHPMQSTPYRSQNLQATPSDFSLSLTSSAVSDPSFISPVNCETLSTPSQFLPQQVGSAPFQTAASASNALSSTPSQLLPPPTHSLSPSPSPSPSSQMSSLNPTETPVVSSSQQSQLPSKLSLPSSPSPSPSSRHVTIPDPLTVGYPPQLPLTRLQQQYPHLFPSPQSQHKLSNSSQKQRSQQKSSSFHSSPFSSNKLPRNSVRISRKPVTSSSPPYSPLHQGDNRTPHQRTCKSFKSASHFSNTSQRVPGYILKAQLQST
ncbi:uncharacterized protein MONOS_8163 [Monocercomonoides exilis]|uniref:uncharacterized protein n=1 Tax=Monocercomonoides exilis TaxID=2049356 RepID=UPI003559C073|nr:hypothetical protein MONOS_8163 [Monocercomonoides exilis]|eukprot:MONOS_8163.1-p1 / transcript=MONOS_8163.1 / gene=MONOS_8163 / organism=Monocercomonoides_exilis_PA203 / gene_product=unspecified product / transcript_product=unspecified product / location=Mono_scaffold00299:45282-48627(+) / protein_length=1048 / sequence_SO=supercontig / SO=protein_coding / is_pseudo=false